MFARRLILQFIVGFAAFLTVAASSQHAWADSYTVEGTALLACDPTVTYYQAWDEDTQYWADFFIAPNFSQNVSVAPFDTSRGTLTSVDVTITVDFTVDRDLTWDGWANFLEQWYVEGMGRAYVNHIHEWDDYSGALQETFDVPLSYEDVFTGNLASFRNQNSPPTWAFGYLFNPFRGDCNPGGTDDVSGFIHVNVTYNYTP